jgi:hypothetical protein
MVLMMGVGWRLEGRRLGVLEVPGFVSSEFG